MEKTTRPLPLGSAFGVELEYMIVDRETLDVAPICDELFKDVAGSYVSDVERGPIDWSNELASHVVELKTAGPARELAPLPALFQGNIAQIDELLAPRGCRLMPGAMHPWMNPDREMKLWQHDNSPIYAAFNRVFDCRGHGWANLQSVHLNLPFAGDAEFGRLHAAIRLVLPLLPALAASSPVMEGRVTGLADNRLEVYRTNSRRVARVAGDVIPEEAYTQAEYHAQILAPLYADIAPLDPEGLLQEEFLNARGAIARFSRNAIEIRLLDVQECPTADVAICALVAAVVERLADGVWSATAVQQTMPITPLVRLLGQTIRDAEHAMIDEPRLLAHFGLGKKSSLPAGKLWRHLYDEVRRHDPALEADFGPAIEHILHEGTLANRLRRRLGDSPSPGRLAAAYRRMTECLSAGVMLE